MLIRLKALIKRFKRFKSSSTGKTLNKKETNKLKNLLASMFPAILIFLILYSIHQRDILPSYIGNSLPY